MTRLPKAIKNERENIFMPRKKTIQPEPLDIFSIDDIACEIRDNTCQAIGRGLKQKYCFEDRLDSVLVWLLDEEYVTKAGDGNGLVESEFLSNASVFSRELETTSFFPPSGDNSSVRKKLYPEVKRLLRIYHKALQEQHVETCRQ